MKKFFCLISVIILISGNYTSAQNDAFTQISIIDALLNGVYDGETSLGELKKYGDFGLGTFNGLDGEMVIFEGNVYRVDFGGKVSKQPENVKTPFAVVADFHSDYSYSFSESLGMQQFLNKIDSLLPSLNYFYAVKIKGKFSTVKTRSVPKQSKPYKPLAEVVKNQSLFNFENTEGTIIGFRCPPFAKAINLSGYHFHFLTGDLNAGGHVLDFTITNAELSIDFKSSVQVFLPGDDDFKKQNFSFDKESDLMKAEKK